MTALLAISHGTDDLAGQRAVSALVDAVARTLPGVTVGLGHVDVQQPDVATSLAALREQAGREKIALVPLLLSAGYHVHVDLRAAVAGLSDVAITPALGPDDRLVDVLVQRLRDAGWDAADTSPVVLAVAGSSDERANDDCREMARRLGERLERPVSVGFLAAREPRLRDVVAAVAASGARAVVASYLLAPGFFHDLAVRDAAGALVARPLLDSDAPAPSLVDLVVDRYRAAR